MAAQFSLVGFGRCVSLRGLGVRELFRVCWPSCSDAYQFVFLYGGRFSLLKTRGMEQCAKTAFFFFNTQEKEVSVASKMKIALKAEVNTHYAAEDTQT